MASRFWVTFIGSIRRTNILCGVRSGCAVANNDRFRVGPTIRWLSFDWCGFPAQLHCAGIDFLGGDVIRRLVRSSLGRINRWLDEDPADQPPPNPETDDFI